MKNERELRFKFGENWERFLSTLDGDRIMVARASVRELLAVNDLSGKSFLDVGSGSGLFSLVARQLGAKVHSFDYDPQSVACTAELKRRYYPDDSLWTVEQGSVLDKEYITSLGEFDVVYSWGVLHHTGDMWNAMENIVPRVAPGGRLVIAIYNDQGQSSRYWTMVKRCYNKLPSSMRVLVLYPTFIRLWGPTFLKDALNGRPSATWQNRKNTRGMTPWRDTIDWVGGYPFEVAKPEEIFDFYKGKGFGLLKLKTCAGGIGCNEFVFGREL